MKQKTNYFLLATAGIFLLIVSFNLFSDGMFLDGLTYAAVANNLSNNIGDFWHLHYTDTLLTNFHEHPPLAIWLESLFFDVLGGSIFTERIYSLTTFIVTGYIIVAIWREITKKKYIVVSWLPVFIWMITPLVIWAVSNNILENTMMIFTSLSILFSIKYLNNKKIVFLILSGLSLFGAFMSKGFVGLFPLSIFFWYFVFEKKYSVKNFFMDSVLLFVFVIIPFLSLFAVEADSYDSISRYISKQVVGSITNVRTVDTRFQILINLFDNIIPILILLVLIFFNFKKLNNKRYANDVKVKTWAFTLFAIGLSGVVPIMISLKQRGFYILPTYPFFAIAIALLIKERILLFSIISRLKTIKMVAIALITIAFISISINSFRVGRDKEFIEDLYAIIDIVPKNSSLSVDNTTSKNWGINAYFSRYANISLDKKTPPEEEFLLIDKNNKIKDFDNYTKVTIPLNKFFLYKKSQISENH